MNLRKGKRTNRSLMCCDPIWKLLKMI